MGIYIIINFVKNNILCITMNCSMRAIVAVVLVLGLTAYSTEAVKCYVCSAVDGKACNDPFDKNANVQTQDNCATCSKAKFDAAGVKVVARSCDPVALGKGCQSASYQGQSADMCYCDSDLCNSSTRMSVSMAVVLSFGLGVMMLKKMF